MVEPNDRPPLVVALEWANKIITVALMMALPALIGWWIDGRAETEPWALVLGAILGFITGLYQLIKFVRPPNRRGQ